MRYKVLKCIEFTFLILAVVLAVTTVVMEEPQILPIVTGHIDISCELTSFLTTIFLAVAFIFSQIRINRDKKIMQREIDEKCD